MARQGKRILPLSCRPSPEGQAHRQDRPPRRRGSRRRLPRGADPLGLRAHQALLPRQPDQPGARAVEAGARRVLQADGHQVGATEGAGTSDSDALTSNGSGGIRRVVVWACRRDPEVGQDRLGTRMLPKLLLWVKPPEMGCHDRECSRPDIVDQGDRSMAVATRDEQPTPGHCLLSPCRDSSAGTRRCSRPSCERLFRAGDR